MKKIYVASFLVFVFAVFGVNAHAQTNQSEVGSTGSGYSAALMKILLDQIEASAKALSNVTVVPDWTVPASNGTATTPNISTTCGSLTTDLRFGDSGPKVLNLSKFLIKEGLLSKETSSFNNTVFQAVVAYQEKYASVILTPVGLSRGTGFVGPSTRAHMNSHLGCTQSTISGNTTTNTGGGSRLPSGDVVGSGSGNAITLPTQTGSVKVLVLNSNPNNPDTLSTLVPVSDYKISPKAGIFVYGSIVDEYDGWAKVSVNGTDYPVAGPGSSIVINGTTYSPCTSCQNHDTGNLFHLTVPNLPVADNSDVTLKLYKSDTAKPPFIVPQTFKYYSSPQLPASDPYILPDANPNQSYNQPLTSKIGSGTVSWIPHLIAGVVPRGFDVNSASITYDPTSVYAKPNIGDVGLFIMWGIVGGQDVAQKFKLNLKSSTTPSPIISSVSPSTLTTTSISASADVTISGQNFSAGNGTKVEFKSGNGILVPATSFSVTNSTTIKARVPASLSVGSYQTEVTIGGLVATPQNGDSSKQMITITPGNTSATGAYASLTANGSYGSITVNAGDTIKYVWSGSNADTATSAFTSAGDSCGWGTMPWVASTVNGQKSDLVQSCQRGGIYVITFQVKNSQTGATARSTLLVKVNP